MRGLIAWFAGHRVAANLLMVAILAGGLLTVGTLTMEVFPEFSPNRITVSVPYPGAAPGEVEEGVVVRIEEAIQDLPGVQRLRSTAAEGVGVVSVELTAGTELERLLNDVKSRVDAIDTFPTEAERPVVQELVIERQVVSVAVSGEASPRTLKRLAEQVRDDLGAIPGITRVQLSAARPDEVVIEVSEEALSRHGLTFDQVAAAVRRGSLDLPGGSVRTEGGEVLLRTKGQAYRGEELERLPLVALPDGRRLAVGDVARVVDGFAETDQEARFDGRPAVLVQVFHAGEQNALELASAVKEYVAAARLRLPEGVSLTTWQDDSLLLKSRLELLLRNGRAGFVLVFLLLALFLRLRLAGWVAVGIPVSFLGAVLVMGWTDVSINLISLFAFIVVLGIVVDDAIVVGENIYRHFEAGKERLRAAVDGAAEVATPVVFAILTTVAAFAPLLMVGGNMGKVMKVIPIIVIATLVFSLIESLLVLPRHLSHLEHRPRPVGRLRAGWRALRERFADSLGWVAQHWYRPSLRLALHWRYLTLAASLALLLAVAGLVAGGWVRFYFFPPVEADNAVAILVMPQGTPSERTAEAVARIEGAALELAREIEAERGERVVRHVLASVGEQPFRSDQSHMGGSVGSTYSGAHLGEVNIELAPSEQRSVGSEELAERWRRKVGPIADAVELSFTASLFSTGKPVHVELSGPDPERLGAVAGLLKAELARFPGVLDITDSYREGKEEVRLTLTPEGEAAGLTTLDLGRQVRQAFFGEEAQRLQRGRDDVRVMVRYPEEQRRSLGHLEAMRLRTPGGAEVPFSLAARAETSRGPAAIQRVDRRRVVEVTADVDTARAIPRVVLAELEGEVLPRILAGYPEVRYAFEGQQQEQRDTLSGLVRGFAMALLAIYALLAIPFRSYLQPLIVMSAIPFGLIGAVLGHLIMRTDLTVLSLFGVVALTGVVVNNSLVMVDFVNRGVAAGAPLRRALREAGVVRFRPILMTSLTTFAGLTPLLFERSMQAQFLLPMAISLAFGVLFSTFITLVLVPALYLIAEDVRGAWARFRSDAPLPAPGPRAA